MEPMKGRLHEVKDHYLHAIRYEHGLEYLGY